MQKGVAIPLVLGILTLLIILIIVLSRASSTTYAQTALVHHNLHARYLALSAIEQATALVHDRLSDPLAVNTWKIRLLEKVFAGQEFLVDITDEVNTVDLFHGQNVKDPLNPSGFQGGRRVFDVNPSRREARSRMEILEVSVRFHHFKPIRFDTQNPSIYHDPRRYYRDPLGSQPPLPPRGDFFGFCTISVRARFGQVERGLQITRDIKIANVEPIARNYALFAFGVPDPSSAKKDLNSPGNLAINARGVGRIRIMGPYYVDVEGYPDGTGTQPVGLSYPRNSWDSYGFIPSPRGITTNGFLFSSGKIERPRNTSGNSGTSFGIGSTGGLSFVLTSDPGYKAFPEVQNYWAGSVPVGKQYFSITGLREAPFQAWKGLLYQAGSPNSRPVGEFSGIETLGENLEARIEGTLIGNYHQMQLTKRHMCLSLSTLVDGFSALSSGMGSIFGGENQPAGGTNSQNSSQTSTGGKNDGSMGQMAMDALQICMHFYQVKRRGKVPYYFAMHGPYSDRVNKLEAFMGILNDVMQSVGTSGANQEGGIGQALSSSIKNMADTARNAEMGQNRLRGELAGEDAAWAPDALGVLPSNFKPVARTMARKYKSLEEHFKLTGGDQDGLKNLYLDGNIWVDDLISDTDITYFGKGTIFSAFTPESLVYTAQKDAVLGAVKPSRPGLDHINLFYRNLKNPLQGDGMLTLKGNLTGSVYSYQGVKPSANIEIRGNLIAELLNKSRFQQGNNLSVQYDPSYQKADKKPYAWVTVSISPKISGLGNHFKGLGGILGSSQRSIVESIGE
jgi:hypothetical protein